jgi:hypothetical protein
MPRREANFVGDAGGFDGPETKKTPLRYGRFLDEAELAGGCGLVFDTEGVEEFEEGFAGLALDENGAGEEAVLHGVTGGVAFAYG